MLRRVRRRLLLALCALLLVAGGAVWWRDHGKRLFFARNFEEVEPGLYRSGRIHRRLIESVLRDNRLDLVIDLAGSKANDSDDVAESEATARLGVRRVVLTTLHGDGRGDPEDYVRALTAMAEARAQGQRVLVRCGGGSVRTGSFFLLYRTLFERWSAADALAEYARFRDRAADELTTTAFLDAHVAEIAAGLVASGALAKAPESLPVFSPIAVSTLDEPARGKGWLDDWH
jgi:protein-tyrosine phosphatase